MTAADEIDASSVTPLQPKGPATMRSLSRALDVFEQLQRSDRPQRLSDIARANSMNLPTTLRILRALQDYGLVSQTDKYYRIGPAVLPAARSFLETDPLVVAARPVLQQLAQQTTLTASLYTRLGHDRVLVARVDGEDPLRYDLPLGKRLPLTVGAAGKILVAGLADEELQRVVDAAVAQGQEPAGFTLADLKRRLPDEGEDYSFSADERATGIMSIAVAVPTSSPDVRESIALTTPVETRTHDELRAAVPELRRAARRLSELLVGIGQ
ncbi:IclR family transcriptional regulator [Arthrobacter sp. TmT3-37]